MKQSMGRAVAKRTLNFGRGYKFQGVCMILSASGRLKSVYQTQYGLITLSGGQKQIGKLIPLLEMKHVLTSTKGH
jgi:hypothetical protein